MTTLAPALPAAPDRLAPTTPAPAAPRIRPFSVDEYHRLADLDFFPEGQRTELIDGFILDMAPIGPPHFFSVNRISRALWRVVPDDVIVGTQHPFRLNEVSEPEPDVLVLRPGASETAMPTAADILLLVEVSVTTEAFDRNVKVPRYAAAGVPEVWIVLPGLRAVDVFRRPGPGGYAEQTRVSESDTVHFLGADLSVTDLLPPAA